MRQGHAVLVERDDARFQVQIVHQLGGGDQRVIHARDRAAGSQARLEAVGRHRRATAVFAVIGLTNGVRHGTDAALFGGGDGRLQETRRANALVVIADEDDVVPAHLLSDNFA